MVSTRKENSRARSTVAQRQDRSQEHHKRSEAAGLELEAPGRPGENARGIDVTEGRAEQDMAEEQGDAERAPAQDTAEDAASDKSYTEHGDSANEDEPQREPPSGETERTLSRREQRDRSKGRYLSRNSRISRRHRSRSPYQRREYSLGRRNRQSHRDTARRRSVSAASRRTRSSSRSSSTRSRSYSSSERSDRSRSLTPRDGRNGRHTSREWSKRARRERRGLTEVSPQLLEMLLQQMRQIQETHAILLGQQGDKESSPRPPTYNVRKLSPTSTSAEIEDWIEGIEDGNQTRRNASDHQLIQWTPIKADDKIATSWRAFCAALMDNEGKKRSGSWKEFPSYVRKEHIAPEYHELEIREQLFKMQQGFDENPWTLWERYQANHQRIGRTVAGSEDWAYDFFFRLRREVRQYFRKHGIPIKDPAEVALKASGWWLEDKKKSHRRDASPKGRDSQRTTRPRGTSNSDR